MLLRLKVINAALSQPQLVSHCSSNLRRTPKIIVDRPGCAGKLRIIYANAQDALKESWPDVGGPVKANQRPLHQNAVSMQIFDSILNAIGQTPLVRLRKISPPGGAEILAKAEFLNPGGSVKDRMALYIIEEAEKSGWLKPGATIVENTSGNTGVGVALVAAIKGYKAIFTMPDKMSIEKINFLKAFGAKVIVTPTNVPADSPLSYYETAKRIARETPNSFYLNQYHNPKNIEAHYQITGPEIWQQTHGQIDCLVAGIGTGGTLSGAGRFLKEKNRNIQIIAVDPIGSVFYHYFKTGKLPTPHVYKVEGIGEDMLTKAMDFSVVDEIYQVNDKDSFLMARRLTTEEGLFVGGSSGAAVWVAVKVAEKMGSGKRIVVILPDSGDRYLSKIYSDEWMKDNGFLEVEDRWGKVSDILQLRKQKRVIVARSSDQVKQVIAKMKRYDISQLPVIDNGKVTGMITEVDLLNYMVSGKHRLSATIKDIIEPDVNLVDPDTSIKTLSEIFANSNCNAVLVIDKSKLVGLVSKIDMIDFLAKKFKE